MQRCSIDRSVQGEFWAIASQTGLLRKPNPTPEHLNGTGFPVEASSGNCSPESALRLGCNFPMGPSGKLRPGICSRNGTRFPRGPKQPPAPRHNDLFSSVACESSRECPKVPALKERPKLPAVIRRNSKSPRWQQMSPARAWRALTKARYRGPRQFGLPNGTGTRCLRRLTKRSRLPQS